MKKNLEKVSMAIAGASSLFVMAAKISAVTGWAASVSKVPNAGFIVIVNPPTGSKIAVGHKSMFADTDDAKTVGNYVVGFLS